MNVLLRKVLNIPWVSGALVGSLIGAGVVGEVCLTSWASTALNEEEKTKNYEQRVTVHIENRRFMPQLIRLRVGQPTRLILLNDDAELHAFVPTDLLAQTNVQVGGNGAPQFDDHGFYRVLVPSSGQAELLFSPKHVGSYSFFCDLPGHVMNGIVVVEGKKDMLL